MPWKKSAIRNPQFTRVSQNGRRFIYANSADLSIMSEPMKPSLFHPAVANWFAKQFPGATPPQERAWPAIKNQQNTLIAAPTGSGKTLAAFLAAIDDLVRLGVEGKLDDTTHVIYVSPLQSSEQRHSNQPAKKPLEGIAPRLQALGLPEVNIRTLVRTGDTPAAERTAMIKRPPHICVTTPESLYILLTSEGGRRMLRTARTLIVDEIHALVGRQARLASCPVDRALEHLAAQHSLERSAISNQQSAISNSRLVRIGLSATQRPIEEVARFLVGTANLKSRWPRLIARLSTAVMCAGSTSQLSFPNRLCKQ